MRFFHPGNRQLSARHEEIWAAYELAYTVVDFAAAGMFVVGSVLFFYPATTFAATWLFLIGSICFGLKPSIRMAREVRLMSLGEVDELAKDYRAEAE